MRMKPADFSRLCGTNRSTTSRLTKRGSIHIDSDNLIDTRHPTNILYLMDRWLKLSTSHLPGEKEKGAALKQHIDEDRLTRGTDADMDIGTDTGTDTTAEPLDFDKIQPGIIYNVLKGDTVIFTVLLSDDEDGGWGIEVLPQSGPTFSIEFQGHPTGLFCNHHIIQNLYMIPT